MIRRWIATILSFQIGFFILTPILMQPANADLPQDVPPECQVYVDERSDYLLAVIGNVQADLAFQVEQTEYWHEAHDRVAANAVERNWEYAAEVRKNEKLHYKLNYWKQLYRQLKERG